MENAWSAGNSQLKAWRATVTVHMQEMWPGVPFSLVTNGSCSQCLRCPLGRSFLLLMDPSEVSTGDYLKWPGNSHLDGCRGIECCPRECPAGNNAARHRRSDKGYFEANGRCSGSRSCSLGTERSIAEVRRRTGVTGSLPSRRLLNGPVPPPGNV